MKDFIPSKNLKRFIFLIVVFFAGSFFANSQELYFENPIPLTSKNTQFPIALKSVGRNYVFFEEVSENKLYINFISRGEEENQWSVKKNVAGPFEFLGEVPDIYTACALDDGTLTVGVTLSQYEIGVYTSKDGGESFSFVKLSMSDQRIVAPRIFKTKKGEFVLFASLGSENKFSIAFSKSHDGIKWSSFTHFLPSRELDNSFSPFLCPTPEGDMVVFQAHFSVPNKPKTFQLYSTLSKDDLKTFSVPVLLSDDSSTANRRRNSFIEYSNQSPALFFDGKKILCAWERNEVRSESTYIALAVLDFDGKIPEKNRVREYDSQKKSHRPNFFNFLGENYLLWFDENQGAYQVKENSNGSFSYERLIKNSAKASFIYPVISSYGKEIAYIWQKKEGQSQLFLVRQDKFAQKPVLTPVSFRQGSRSRQEKVRVNLTIPQDTNGIAGYSWSFSLDENEEPSTQDKDLIVERNLSSGKSYSLNASAFSDGKYYFKAKVLDMAGNWSDSASLEYYRDLTPPKKVTINDLPKDEYSFLQSSTFTINWQKDESDSDIAGYSWALTRVDSLDEKFKDSKNHPQKSSKEKIESYIDKINRNEKEYLKRAKEPPRSILTKKASCDFNNIRNGIYVFSVCGIDEVGNVGESQKILLIANKYIPFTFISGLKTSRDELGALQIDVYGQDFSTEGYISQIFIDRDGKLPYDRVLNYNKGEFQIKSNSLITGIHLEDLDVGNYGIFLYHTERGISPLNANSRLNRFSVDESGTVKIESPYQAVPVWKSFDIQKTKSLSIVDLLIYLAIFLGIFICAFSIRGIVFVYKESVLIHSQVLALLNGGDMPLTKKMKIEKLKRRQTSLKLKLVLFTVLLVLAIVMMVSLSLGKNMIKTQRQTLSESMYEQVLVLLEGMSNSVQNAMLDAREGGGTVALIDLVKQADTFKSAVYATIIGRGLENNDSNLDYFWASTQTSSEVAQKLDAGEALVGKSRFKAGTIEQKIAISCASLESQAHQKVDSILLDLDEKYSKEKKDEYTQILRDFSRLNTKSFPDFNLDSIANDDLIYTFYYPVFYRSAETSELLNAILILQISTEELVNNLARARASIIVIAVIVAMIAIALGIIGSWILASLIVEPIKKLVQHVKIITETKDKKKLKDFTISVKSHDEIGTLGQAVNEMTDGLVKAAEDEEKAAEQEKMALDGKAVQQTFLPLNAAERGGKQTTAELKEKNVEIFGYYEGADAVSGDYFDYKKLDERFYAIIKCDVSGHGVPAALMMTVVATLFRKYFENWTFKEKGTSLNRLVVDINDFIESLGVKGKFATLMICLFDTKTGDVYVCNAGDNIIHVFDQNTKQEKTITLHEAPAAGPLPSFMVDMKGGFIVEKIHLNSGDVLLLYTDGIEEATRFFRDSNYEVTQCRQEGLKEGDVHFNHKVGQTSSQLEAVRVKQIVEAALNRKQFVLTKYHNPIPNESLIFDFSTLEGTIDDSIMALVSVEKIFRIYKRPDSKGSVQRNEKGDVVITGDGIRVDRKIDAFLKKTFNRYDFYCSSLVDMEEENYVYYTNVNEDPQADDLTLLAIKKV